MPTDWQNITALAVVAVAVAYVLRRAWRIVRGRRGGGCGTCGTCPSNSPDEKAIVPVDSLLAPRNEPAASNRTD